MTTTIERHNHLIDRAFDQFITTEVLPLTEVKADRFWQGLVKVIEQLGPVNRDLDKGTPTTGEQHSYRQWLENLGRLQAHQQTNSGRDTELNTPKGPQLTTPLNNARFALNGANARWGSLYHALYNSDAIPKTTGLTIANQYNAARGNLVINYAKDFLDQVFPLQEGSHRDVTAYLIYYENLWASFADGRHTGLQDNSQFVASNGSKNEPTSILLQNNGLHLELQIDHNGTIGAQDLAGIDDIVMEAALTTLMDAEEATAIDDKLRVYRNWLGLMTDGFTDTSKNRRRHLQPDRHFTAKDGSPYNLGGRSLLLMQTNGLHEYTDLMTDSRGNPVAAEIIDCVVSALIGSLDAQPTQHRPRNSRSGHIYLARPQETGTSLSFYSQLFTAIEELLALPADTLKLCIDPARCQIGPNADTDIGGRLILINGEENRQTTSPAEAILAALECHLTNSSGSQPIGFQIALDQGTPDHSEDRQITAEGSN